MGSGARRRCTQLLPSGCPNFCQPSRWLRAPAPTTAFGKFSIIYNAQQFGDIDEVGLVDRQLFSAVSDFCAYPDGPYW